MGSGDKASCVCRTVRSYVSKSENVSHGTEMFVTKEQKHRQRLLTFTRGLRVVGNYGRGAEHTETIRSR